MRFVITAILLTTVCTLHIHTLQSEQTISLYPVANWNENFDQETELLINTLFQFRQKSYINKTKEFSLIRKVLCADQQLVNKLRYSKQDEKLLIKHDDFTIIKKRRNNKIRDLYPWELSFLLGSDKYITPSFPVEIDTIRVIIQKKESFEYGTRKGNGYSKSIVKKISLETYWKAHLQAYLLGLGDLKFQNIGINADSIIRFFDIESCFNYDNIPKRNERSFSATFKVQSFDWPQYRAPLDKKTARLLREYIQQLTFFEQNIRTYLQLRKIDIDIMSLQQRIEKIRCFLLQEGVSFRDLMNTIYPIMGPGLDQLNAIVQEILHRKVDHGTSLFFITQWIRWNTLNKKQQTQITAWINTYIRS